MALIQSACPDKRLGQRHTWRDEPMSTWGGVGGSPSTCTREGPLLEPPPQTSSLQACKRSAVPVPGLRAWSCSPRTLPSSHLPESWAVPCACALFCSQNVSTRIRREQRLGAHNGEEGSANWPGGLPSCPKVSGHCFEPPLAGHWPAGLRGHHSLGPPARDPSWR